MEIIITSYFEKLLHKNCKKIKVEEIIKKLNINSKNFIYLKVPFYKVKLKIWNKSYRLLLFADEKFIKLLFISIFDKKDKVFWENINWKLSQNEIIKFYEENLSYLKDKQFKKFNKEGEIIK